MKTNTKTLTVTVPKKMYAQIEKQRKIGDFNRSEFVRNALRSVLTVSSEQATPEEIALIKKGRKEIEKGNYFTHEEVFKNLL